MIHPSAIVDSAAELAGDVDVGPYAIIGPEVRIDAGTRIGPHAVLSGPTRIGRGNTIHAHAVVGGDPQDKKYSGERTELWIGDGNTIREFVTIHRGTGAGGGRTVIGNENWIMAYVHIAHDCRVGDHTILANNAALAGHVEVDDWAILGGYTLVHQFCKIGAHAFTSMGSKINCDVAPYVVVAGEMSVPKGINVEGLKRRGFTPAQIQAIRRAYKALYTSGLRLEEARLELGRLAAEHDAVAPMLAFLDRSTRSLLR